MRWFEIASGFRLPVCSEEQEMLNRAEKEPMAKATMDERDEEVARLMVSRGVLKQVMKDDEVYYIPNSAKDIWRDR